MKLLLIVDFLLIWVQALISALSLAQQPAAIILVILFVIGSLNSLRWLIFCVILALMLTFFFKKYNAPTRSDTLDKLAWIFIPLFTLKPILFIATSTLHLHPLTVSFAPFLGNSGGFLPSIFEKLDLFLLLSTMNLFQVCKQIHPKAVDLISVLSVWILSFLGCYLW